MKQFSWRGSLICLLLMAVALVSYWPATQAQFVSWDDGKVVPENPVLDKPSWPAFFERWTKPYLGVYMPMTQTFYQAVSVIGSAPDAAGKLQFNPAPFHWGVVIIRLLNIPLIFIFLRRIVRDDWAAGAGAAVMALHPIGVEALAWVTEVSTPLCALFAIASLWQWLLFRQHGHALSSSTDTSRENNSRDSTSPGLPGLVESRLSNSPSSFAESPHPNPLPGCRERGQIPYRRAHYIAATLLFVLALLSKPLGVCVPVLAFALDIWIVRINWKQSLRSLWPWLIPAAALAIFMKHLQPPPEGLWIPAVWQRPFVAIDAIFFYLGKILVPHSFGIDYGRTPAWVLSQHSMLLIETIAMVLLAIALYLLRRRKPILICAAIFFLAGMVPVFGLTPFWFQSFSTVADRYAYLPLLGVAMIVAALFTHMRYFGPWILLAAALLICAIQTYRQSQTWHDSYALYAQARQANPRSWMAWDNTAYDLIGDHHVEEGLTYARVACALDPAQPDIYSNIGTALAILGHPRQAIPYFRRVMMFHPEDSVIAMNLGAAYTQLGQYHLGVKWLEYGHKLNPTSKKNQSLLAGAIQLRDLHDHLATQPSTRSGTRP